MREPQLSRVGGLLCRLVVRASSRARVQRDPERVGAHRRLAALQILLTGEDATRLVDRVITRDANKIKVGQVVYTPWCDERGKVIDDGTVSRLDENVYRWTAADPNLRWLRQNALGLKVEIEDVSEDLAALAIQGPTSGRLLARVADADVANLRYFRVTSGSIAGVPVDISRTGYTGDLGYEVWIPAKDALVVWDAVVEGGRAFDAQPAGMLALDVARIEAGLLLIEVDFNSSKKALIESQKYSPFEMSLGRLVNLDKSKFVGQAALARSNDAGTRERSSVSTSNGPTSSASTTPPASRRRCLRLRRALRFRFTGRGSGRERRRRPRGRRR